jgi:CRISPR/Cas system Type II protein with McrA/HNH and RuvC-like nuclease domain
VWVHPVSFDSASKIIGTLGNKENVVIDMPLIMSRWERKIGKTFGQKGSVDIEVELTGASRLKCRQILNNRSHENEPALMLTSSDSSVNQLLHQAKKTKSRKGIGPKLRRDVMQRDNYTCKECGASPKTSKGVFLEIDHVIPVSKGGGNEIANLQTLCDVCNAGKGNQLPENANTDYESDDPWGGTKEKQAC